ncbi:heme exporter protein CcmD [Alteromonas sp. LMIT006]|uniref:heme exporter protein CcmD n=1 Tax=Alteromonadaceae TaxID=72275 RepID=UPI0020CA4538|nr:heme exporter protein CcmD [Alteromonas sp. LMIT006]UTP72619.1 heme exporter protein CcmD [Alteromonas sp. LMIT006]
MAFDSFADFIAMGGYGFFVWLSYGVSFLSIVLYIVYVKRQKRQLTQHVVAQQAREARIAAAKQLQEK